MMDGRTRLITQTITLQLCEMMNMPCCGWIEPLRIIADSLVSSPPKDPSAQQLCSATAKPQAKSLLFSLASKQLSKLSPFASIGNRIQQSGTNLKQFEQFLKREIRPRLEGCHVEARPSLPIVRPVEIYSI
jgi:hypothetical protein